MCRCASLRQPSSHDAPDQQSQLSRSHFHSSGSERAVRDEAAPSSDTRPWIDTGIGRHTLVNHAALALFGHVRSIRGKQHYCSVAWLPSGPARRAHALDARRREGRGCPWKGMAVADRPARPPLGVAAGSGGTDQHQVRGAIVCAYSLEAGQTLGHA